MKERPIKILVDALRSIGAQIEYLEKEGFPPIIIKESIPGKKKLVIDGGISSQYISALMLIAPNLQNGLEIELKNDVVSRPYIEMTKNIMEHFGAKVIFEENKISVSNIKYQPNSFLVEGDWSGASYWYSIAALSRQAEIRINSLSKKSTQGDRVVADIYKKFNVETSYFNDYIVIRKTKNKKLNFIFEYDFSTCPDLAQTIVVTCLALKLKANIKGLQTLKIKETDRIQALKNECEKLGARVNITANSLELFPNELRPASVDTYNDHRMAMAFAPLALKIDGLKINDEQVVKKSYPNFWEEIQRAGVIESRKGKVEI